MKILQLNVWTGRLKGALERFVRENDADILCMQEAVWSEDNPGVVNYAFDSVDKIMTIGGYEYDYRSPNFGIKIGDDCLMKQGNVILSTDPLGDERHVKCMHEVADLFRDEKRPVIMCGDLNVISESPAMRELDFMRDLTAENHIVQTLQNLKFVKNVACDHVLVNDKIIVKDYHTVDQLASDHKAVLTEFEL